jgi:hypothetical protein
MVQIRIITVIRKRTLFQTLRALCYDDGRNVAPLLGIAFRGYFHDTTTFRTGDHADRRRDAGAVWVLW